MAKRKASELSPIIGDDEEESATVQQPASELIGNNASSADDFSNDILLVIFDFVSRRDLVQKVSFVSKKWCSISRSPSLWDTLDDQEGMGALKFRSTHVNSIERLSELLKRKQFSNLKRICPPRDIVDNERCFKVIAENCRAIEEIDTWNSYIPMSSLLELPALFPNLRKLDISLIVYTSGQDLMNFCQRMGPRLVELRVKNVLAMLDDKCFKAIIENCVNLKRFGYYMGPHNRHAFVTKGAVLSLVKNCPRLQSLSLIHTTWLDSGIYSAIVKNAANLTHLRVVGYSDSETKAIQETCTKVADKKTLKLECVSKSEYLQLVEKCRGKSGGAFYLGHQWYH